MRSIKGIFLYIAALFVILPACAQADAQGFLRPLRKGDSGPDVFALQQLLNKVLPTPIAATGDGSPGNETLYFGSKTRVAVIRLQEQFAADILTPAGLRYGTGTVGPQTLVTLNRLWADLHHVAQPAINSPAASATVHLLSMTPENGTFGTAITLKGSGFTKDNTILTSYDDVKHVSSADGTTLTFSIPSSIHGISFTAEQLVGVDPTIPFWIYVTNENGQSEALQFMFSPI